MDKYEQQLDEHIAWLQKQLDEAAAFRHKREQYMHGTPFPELLAKWEPMTKMIKKVELVEAATMHLEYASHFIEEHKLDKWKQVLLPAIARWYDECGK